MFRNIGAPEILILAVLLIVIFGWKRLPEAARSLGRSARVFKSEMQEMRSEGKPSETIKGETTPTSPVQEASPVSPVQGTTPASPAQGATPTGPAHENTPRTDNQPGQPS
jgi:sec-independent protein translocase protein TatA